MRACSVSSSTSTSPTARSSSVADTSDRHPLRVDDARNGHDVVPAHDERPSFTVGARDLCVDEHVLDLPLAAGETVAGMPPPYYKPCELRLDAPGAPVDRAPKLDRPALEPDPVVFAHGLDSTPEVDAPRSRLRVDQLGKRSRERPPLVERPEEVLARCRVHPFEERQDLVADQAARRVRVRRVGPPLEPAVAAVRLRLLAPEAEERPHHAVLATHLDPGGASARGQPKEHRLDLVGERMAGRTQLPRA